MPSIYETVTANIVKAMETAGDDVQLPWRRSAIGGAPKNATTGKYYRGVNVLALWCDQMTKGYDSNLWATYKQWKSIGAQVREGEKSSIITIYKPVSKESIGADGEKVDDSYMMLKGAYVFNARQVDGYELPQDGAKPTEIEAIAHAENYMGNTKARIQHGGNRAYFRPSDDIIQMPERTDFFSQAGYYGTLLHEAVHWTGAEKRLDRKFGKSFGDDDYAKEELVAELGAAFLCCKLGVTNEPRKDHAQYLNNWLKVLKGDPKAIFKAASFAQKAVEFMDKMQPEMAAEQERIAA